MSESPLAPHPKMLAISSLVNNGVMVTPSILRQDMLALQPTRRFTAGSIVYSASYVLWKRGKSTAEGDRCAALLQVISKTADGKKTRWLCSATICEDDPLGYMHYLNDRYDHSGVARYAPMNVLDATVTLRRAPPRQQPQKDTQLSSIYRLIPAEFAASRCQALLSPGGAPDRPCGH